jgi:Fur family transcriptional regulator, peroxide stress response regulator
MRTNIMKMRRFTRQREAILKILKGNTSHPTADLIYEEVKKEIPNISKGTIYRNLQVLEKEGAVTELNLDGALSRYEIKQDCHYHFRCEKCGRVIDLDEPINQELNDKVSKRTGFQVSYHQIEFRGLCQNCWQ